jgi:hypothetical protein
MGLLRNLGAAAFLAATLVRTDAVGATRLDCDPDYYDTCNPYYVGVCTSWYPEQCATYNDDPGDYAGAYDACTGILNTFGCPGVGVDAVWDGCTWDCILQY